MHSTIRSPTDVAYCAETSSNMVRGEGQGAAATLNVLVSAGSRRLLAAVMMDIDVKVAHTHNFVGKDTCAQPVRRTTPVEDRFSNCCRKMLPPPVRWDVTSPRAMSGRTVER